MSDHGRLRLLHRPHRAPNDPSARLRRVRTLPHDRSACAELLAAVDDPSLQVARAALLRLAAVGGKAEGTALAGRLLDVDIGLVPDCARAVALLDRAGGGRVAQGGLGCPAAHIRQAAAVALATLAWPPARVRLERALDDDAASVRRAAVDALRALESSPRTVSLLVDRLTDRDAGVRGAAVAAVARLAPSPSEALRQTLADPSPRVRLELARNTGRLTDHLVVRLLGDPDESVRSETLWRLCEEPREPLAGAIGDRLCDPRPRVRRAACRALGPLHDPAGDDVLVELLGDPDALVRAAALRALRERRPAGAAGFVSSRLPEVDRRLRPGLLYAIARLDAPVADACVRRLDLGHDDDPAVRLAAVHCCLAGSRDLLHGLASDVDADVRHAARTRLDTNG